MGKKKNKKKIELAKETDYRFIDDYESTLFSSYDLLRPERFSECEREVLDGLNQLILLKVFLGGELLHRKKCFQYALDYRKSEIQNLPVDALRELVESL